jgi:parallel beta-helix repeat protein
MDRMRPAHAALSMLVLAPLARGAVLDVPADHASIQAALAAAQPGDEIRVAPGEFREDLDFLGKAVTVLGSGPRTVVRGTGTGPVVTFASGEGPDSVLDSVTVTGGRATEGGGIHIVDASPTVRRAVISGNLAAARGSGIFVGGAGAAPHLHNNLVIHNAHSAGDPHAVQSVGASPVIENNTVVGNDSNGLFLTGAGAPLVVNNVLAWNGSTVRGEGKRGRGLCDFTQGAVVRHNRFHGNRVAALLRGGQDHRRIRQAQRRLADPDLAGNADGNPGFVRRRAATRAVPADFTPRARSPLHGAGDPDPAYANADGSPNTVGHTGGPWGVRF